MAAPYTSEFPALFTIDGSNRHDIILINPGRSIKDLTSTIEKYATDSPNCAEFMSKYKKKGETLHVTEVVVKWATEGRDKQLFPRQTLLTEDNCEAVLRMMQVGVGKDVIDVKVEKTGGEAEKDHI
ncbi:hypothetical protein LTR66_009161 [Elasticomyces elasticus]|nr:hypothetical protein LTR66_009161 [Elasticomyces elasticus]